MSTGVPSERNGMSSTGRIFEMTPLLPWRPASLSPSEILRFWATYTRTSWLTPGGSSWESSRENTRTSMTLPDSPWGTLSEVSRTSRAFSPKIARRSRSSGVCSVSPLGVTFPTSTSPGPTSAPMRMMPRSSRSARISSERFGMSRVISSAPSLVSRASTSCSSMWIEVSTSSRTSRSREDDGVLEVVALPRHEGDEEVLPERQLAVVGGGPVGQHVVGRDPLALVHDHLLVDRGVLVRAAELGQGVAPAAELVAEAVALAGPVLHDDVVSRHLGHVARRPRRAARRRRPGPHAPPRRCRCREPRARRAARPASACWRPSGRGWRRRARRRG